jgi:ATP-dependent Clp protease ATP-binding subunit ClpA
MRSSPLDRTLALDRTLQAALEGAETRGHGKCDFEHLLYALTDNPEVQRVFTACKADVPGLKSTLDAHFEKQHPNLARHGERPVEFIHLLQGMLNQLAEHPPGFPPRTALTGGDVLLALFDQNAPHTLACLTAAHLTRQEVANYLTCGTTKPAYTGALFGQLGMGRGPATDGLSERPL